MAKFDRYLLSQFLVHFGFFALVLVLVYWVNRAIALFDQLIASGQSALVFLEFTLLTLPNVIRIVLPVAAFASVVYVTNRLQSESELVVVQASGYSPRRLARPVVYFGAVVALMLSVLTHVLVPTSLTQLSAKSIEISENLTAQLLTEGEFIHPVPGLTFYISEVTPEGELRRIFISDSRRDDRRITYTAKDALIARSDTGPKVLLFDGMAQTLNLSTQQLSTTRYREFVYDMAAMIPVSAAGQRQIGEVTTPELLRPTPDLVAEVGRTEADLMFEGHERFTQASLGLVAPVLGFSILMLGGFSRFGMWRQIFGAIVALVLVDTLDNAMAGIARSDPLLVPLAYAAPVAGLIAAWAVLTFAGRTRRRPSPGPSLEAPA